MLSLVIISIISLLTFSYPVSAKTTGTVTGTGVNVRDFNTGKIIGSVNKGATVTIIDVNAGSDNVCKNWYQISYLNSNARICGEYVDLAKGYVKCTTNFDPEIMYNDTNKSQKVKEVACFEGVDILEQDLPSNSYCKKNWYKASYDGVTGYICSAYLSSTPTKKDNEKDTSYGRPWTTPSKAILGGAQFLTSTYISKGQYTSYLKKFNVNPNSTNKVFTHQYMANLAAPTSEAKTSFRAYSNNGLLKLPLSFTIPIYNNMPETTTLPGKETDTSGQSNITDQNFENQLNSQGFPESYKKKLRLLHNTYPNWTFEALNTNLDFNYSVTREKALSSINGNEIYYEKDANGNYTSTESGWYLANTQTTEYYLDPRNFLNDTGILQFESLKYSSNYTEQVVQTILNNTFMEKNSDCDNKSYASIFVEAGKAYNVSPVYLASLAKQESGTNGSIATTGKIFTYKGVTYKWLYNFFNIGAYSSEESPIRAGLVYASGGDSSVITTSSDTDSKVCPVSGDNNNPDPKPTPDPTPDPTPNPNPEPAPEPTPTPVTNKGADHYIKSMSATVKKNSYLSGFSVGTTVRTIKNKLSSAQNVSILNSSGAGLSDGERLKTGDKIIITDTDGSTKYSYDIIIYGDVNGDGKITASDYIYIKNYILGKISLSNISKEAADSNKSNSVTAADYIIIKNTILGKASISQA